MSDYLIATLLIIGGLFIFVGSFGEYTFKIPVYW